MSSLCLFSFHFIPFPRSLTHTHTHTHTGCSMVGDLLSFHRVGRGSIIHWKKNPSPFLLPLAALKGESQRVGNLFLFHDDHCHIWSIHTKIFSPNTHHVIEHIVCNNKKNGCVLMWNLWFLWSNYISAFKNESTQKGLQWDSLTSSRLQPWTATGPTRPCRHGGGGGAATTRAWHSALCVTSWSFSISAELKAHACLLADGCGVNVRNLKKNSN